MVIKDTAAGRGQCGEDTGESADGSTCLLSSTMCVRV